MKSLLHYKKPAFWLIATIVIACIVTAACFFAAPAKQNGESEDTVVTTADEPIEQETDHLETGENTSMDILLSQDYQADPVYRLMQLDWDEVRSRNLTMNSEQDWTDIVCIGEIPERKITLYGYNDEECGAKGVAIEIGDDVNYFDWTYTSPWLVLPECYWHESSRQLQIALLNHTGTGLYAQDLHVLQYYDTGTLMDNAFDLSTFSVVLEKRLDYEYDESTSLLTLIDNKYEKELVTVETEQKVVALENMGLISQFILGDTIIFQVQPGFHMDNSIPYYVNMPVLEAEVIMTYTESGIQFDLGELSLSTDEWRD